MHSVYCSLKVIIQSMDHYRHVLIGTKNCCWKTLVIYGSQSFLCVTDRKDQSLYVFIKTNLKQIMKSLLSKKYSLIYTVQVKSHKSPSFMVKKIHNS